MLPKRDFFEENMRLDNALKEIKKQIGGTIVLFDDGPLYPTFTLRWENKENKVDTLRVETKFLTERLDDPNYVRSIVNEVVHLAKVYAEELQKEE